MTKRALCIGTNYAGTSNQLAGCVNDAVDWSEALAGRGYTVTQLLDSGASRNAILAGMRALIEPAESGDRVVFTFSGHGTWLPDRDGDEADRRDEAICPNDFRQAGVISDDELYEVFVQAKRGVRLVWVADSCYSGTIARFAPPLEPGLAAPGMAVGEPARQARFLPPQEWAGDEILEQPAWRAAARAPVKGLSRRSALTLSGCRESEVAYDAHFAGRANGAFTYAALQALRNLPEGASYRRWQRSISPGLLPSSDYPQSPQMSATSTQARWQALT